MDNQILVCVASVQGWTPRTAVGAKRAVHTYSVSKQVQRTQIFREQERDGKLQVTLFSMPCPTPISSKPGIQMPIPVLGWFYLCKQGQCHPRNKWHEAYTWPSMCIQSEWSEVVERKRQLCLFFAGPQFSEAWMPALCPWGYICTTCSVNHPTDTLAATLKTLYKTPIWYHCIRQESFSKLHSNPFRLSVSRRQSSNSQSVFCRPERECYPGTGQKYNFSALSMLDLMNQKLCGLSCPTPPPQLTSSIHITYLSLVLGTHFDCNSLNHIRFWDYCTRVKQKQNYGNISHDIYLI